ncbi:MAG: Chromosome partition protein Smc [Candidatus Giovannonibacteria bacterium GW2011_GWC2_44_9]|uniref:Chromosome partition protein Smc n=3 Tax=Candidatus Giovannoniibacteriota TaxID=1752738 RepID=A0A0G1IY36_9BACT|nr:MAG: Chromosome partition protein Smc [Candidatus Giovannonibacteria bacterium GW2011_GWB1_44_23]KKT63975.1 MAG: Chromosome partition protein Smc [Candidatus Giovannonibacteria bacterium GW2011_GWA1_44_29]KKT83304.1 MAG: Chromosome partition protein Smc [Candidatus Giovannonibacteria bacterium GW2011_GWC2_44_9]KKT91688.1 MAG: Chromosome partition protein Smc [Parcubacteria group bacterium GW2011_GWC1_45_13]
MLLKRLEMSGFKSFAKAVTLEFPTKITSVVGPNGSGKSNIADAIRWVLGEQSMKYLRGKKGEDLIFAGTSQIARLAKASVSLVFDNKQKVFPVEFDEVAMSRRVYRDGANEYLLNNSQVRLKDIIELLSKVGLGASQHHIIAQGDSDRILYASPKEKKSMVEESLGLKIFELKKNEASRKLEATESNIKQVEALRSELKPHLKFLSSQAEKMKNAEELKKQLEALSEEYVSRELKTLAEETEEIKKNKTPLSKKAADLELEIKESETALGRETDAEKFFEELKTMDSALETIFKKRSLLEREIGRLEAVSEAAPSTAAGALPKEKVKAVLMELAKDLESVSQSGTMEAVRNMVFSATQKIYRFLEEINGEDKHKIPALSREFSRAKEAISKLEAEELEIAKKKQATQKNYETRALKIHKEGAMLREKMEELARTKDVLRNFAVKEERVVLLKKELEIDFPPPAGGWIKNGKPAGELLTDILRAEFRKKIERFQIRLEEAGGVDDSILKEFEETKKRDEFLGKELEDLKNAAQSLKNVFNELETKIAKDFNEGLSKINKLFGEFFHEIFGGGKAEIKMEKSRPKKSAEEILEEGFGEFEEEESEPGLEIMVDIPRKRIKSLAMLSGGERALSSIALLFAMSTANPPPFLVLDETDAALDEANSTRYASMLKELGKKTQLIVVTHNRETMKAADVLYGVTMGGDGISKLLSIKFEEAEGVLAKRKAT